MMEKYLKLKSDVAEFEENLKLAITTNKLSHFLRNKEIINRWVANDRELVYDGYKKSFLAKYIPPEISEKYLVQLRINYDKQTDFNFFDLALFSLQIRQKHIWVVKERVSWRDIQIDFFRGGGTKAKFTDATMANDFEFIKSKSIEMVSEILLEINFLESISSNLPWEKLMRKYLLEFLSQKNIDSVNFPVLVGRNQDTSRYSNLLSQNDRAVRHYESNKTDKTETVSLYPQMVVLIWSQLLDNDAFKIGDVISFNNSNFNCNYFEGETKITINNIKDNVVDYSGKDFELKDRHISDITYQLLKLS